MKLTPKDYESIKFHIKSQDYLGTLATALSLVEQNMQYTFSDPKDPRRKTLRKKVEELNYLQANYKIIRKKK